MSSTRRGPDDGFTMIELLMVVAIISITSAIAVPGLMRARVVGNEANAISTLRVVTSSQIAYSASCGTGGYAASFVVLGTPPPASTPFLSPDLGSSLTPVKSGYTFTLGAGAGSIAGPPDCNGTGSITAFYATAYPVTFGKTGSRSFATSATNTIWQSYTGIAPIEPFASPAAPLQ